MLFICCVFFHSVGAVQGWRNGAEWESELPEVTMELHIHTQLVLCGFDTEALKPDLVQCSLYNIMGDPSVSYPYMISW